MTRWQKKKETYGYLVDEIRKQPWHPNQKEEPVDELDKIDQAFSDTEPAPGGNFDPIPEGTEVAVVITNQKADRVGENQTPVCKVTFEVMEPETHKTKKIWHDLWITMNNVKYLKRDLATLGWKEAKLSQLLVENDHSLMCCGARVVTAAPEEYVDRNGNQRQKSVISYFKEHYEYTPTPAEAEKGAPATAAAAPVKEEDIPF